MPLCIDLQEVNPIKAMLAHVLVDRLRRNLRCLSAVMPMQARVLRGLATCDRNCASQVRNGSVDDSHALPSGRALKCRKVLWQRLKCVHLDAGERSHKVE